MDEEGKDSRKQRKVAEEKRNHHKGHVIVGPGIVMKSGGEEEEIDPFGVGCNGVPHSLNKDKRWEKVERADEILGEKDTDATFIKASVSMKSGHYLVPMEASIESVKNHKGGYTSVTKLRKGEVEKREAKSDKSKLHMLVESTQAYGMPKDIQRRTERKGDEKEWNDRRQVGRR